jgi:transketolase
MKYSLEDHKAFCTQVRRDIIRMVHGARSGHPGGSLGCVEFMTILFREIMHHIPEPFDMDGKNQDIFILSNGHITPVYYSVLSRCGYFPVSELRTFRKINSRLQGHPATHEGLPGIRIATGSLGQGLSVAIGAALAKKLNNDPYKIFTLQGDGELQEGQIWEALMFAAAKKVDNLIMTIDYNGRQIDGNVNDVLSLGDLKAKLLAFGWEIIENKNGNDLVSVYHSLTEAKEKTGKGKPVGIIMHTEMGYGVDFMMGTHHWHGVAPNDEQAKRALEQLPETIGDF